MRLLSLAAGTVLELDPVAAVDAAEAAGFPALGLRLDAAALSASQVRLLRQRLASGPALFDLEVIRLGPGAQLSEHRRLLDLGATLGAQWVLTVSNEPDGAARAEQLAQLTQEAAARGLSIAFEFMRFTEVPTLGAALDLRAAVDADNIAILVDALHLARSGGDVTDVAAVPENRLAYLQLCDVDSAVEPQDFAAEARHHRLMPGQGDLPLRSLVAAVPSHVALSVEVQSDELSARVDGPGRARLAMQAALSVLAQEPAASPAGGDSR